MNRPTIYPYCNQCRVPEIDEKLCYANMSRDLQELFGLECPVKCEDERVVNDISESRNPNSILKHQEEVARSLGNSFHNIVRKEGK